MKINLWFNENAEEAVDFYTSIFDNSKVIFKSFYNDNVSKVSGMKKDTVMNILFEIEGQEFLALNGGPVFTFTPAISFIIECETQDKIDFLWNSLSENGSKMKCGWVTDRFGITWQIVPSILPKLMSDSDSNKVEKVTNAMLNMSKMIISELIEASL